jgi:hypothetical protein
MRVRSFKQVVFRGISLILWSLLGQSIFSLLYALIIQNGLGKRDESGGSTRINRLAYRDVFTILVLHEDLYRGDLEMFAKLPNVRVLTFSVRWQQILSEMFYPSAVRTLDWYQAKPNSLIWKKRRMALKTIGKILQYLDNWNRVGTVLAPNVRYREDLDWIAAAHQQRIPSVVLFREGLLMFDRAYAGTKRRHKEFGKFHGTKIIVHNEITKRMFLESGYLNENQIAVGGVPRMDHLLERVGQERLPESVEERALAPRNSQLLIIFFPPGKLQKSIVDSMGIRRPPGVPEQLFYDVMEAVIDLAIERPDVPIVIKPKKGDQSISAFYEFLEKKGIARGQIPNLIVNDQRSLHDEIMNATVVCGLQSTGVLEAAIAQRSVILPFFRAYRQDAWSQRFGLKSYLAAFNVADDLVEFRKMINDALDEKFDDLSKMPLRRKIFKEWVSDPEGGATEKCFQIMQDLAEEYTGRRSMDPPIEKTLR